MKSFSKILLFIAFPAIITISSCSYLNKKHSKDKVKDQIKAVTETHILMETSMGIIKLKLYNETPQHRDNFIKLVKEHFYDSVLFHRVIQNFMIQGGDPDSKKAPAGMMLGNGDVGYTIPAEFNPALIHKKGALAAARTDNPEKASSGCQFYIVQGSIQKDEMLDKMQQRNGWIYTPEQRKIYTTIGGTPFLDNGYTVFGEVTEGLDVVEKIAAVAKDKNDRPIDNLRILKMTIVKGK